MPRTPVIALLSALTLLTAASGAHANTYYVNQSAPGASDGGQCSQTSAPCATIQAAVNKAKTSTGNTVRVLPDPGGTTDTYSEAVVLDGDPIGLRGAGSGAGGTVIEKSNGTALKVSTASKVADLHLRATGSGSGGLELRPEATGSIADRLVVEDADAIGASVSAGVLRDSAVSGNSALSLGAGRVVRSVITGSSRGVASSTGGGALLDSIVRSTGGTGSGVDLASASGAASMTLRHVTVIGFATRLLLHSAGGSVSATVVNSTLAGDGGTTDVSLSGSPVSASLDSVNRSPARTTVSGGATLTDANPIDVPPGLTADGHLAPGSLLIDRGTTGGALAGDPDDALDIDRAPRNQGAAPDVGADETGPAAPVAGGGSDDGGAGGGGGGAGADPNASLPPAITVLTVARSFKSKCPRTRRARSSRCRAGVTIRYALTEDAKVEFTFKQVVRRGKRAKTFKVTHRGRKGRNSFRFSGKVKGKALPAGKFTLTAVARDASGKRSDPVTAKTKVT